MFRGKYEDFHANFLVVILWNHEVWQSWSNILQKLVSAFVGEYNLVSAPALVNVADAFQRVEVVSDDLCTRLTKLVSSQVGFPFAFPSGVHEPYHPGFVCEDFQYLTSHHFHAILVEQVVGLVEDRIGYAVAPISVFVFLDCIVVNLEEISQNLDLI